MWVCKKCGANNSDNALYCGNCGKEKDPFSGDLDEQSKSSKIKAVRNALVVTVLVVTAFSLFVIYFVKNSIYGFYMSESNVYSLSLNWDGSCYWYQNDIRFEGASERDSQQLTLSLDGKGQYHETVFSAVREEQALRITGGTVHNELFVKKTKPEEIKKLDEYGDWTVVKEATCSESGMKQRIGRANPEKIETEVIPKLDHNWEAATYETPETCSLCGKTRGDSIKTVEEKEIEERINNLSPVFGVYYIKADDFSPRGRFFAVPENISIMGDGNYSSYVFDEPLTDVVYISWSLGANVVDGESSEKIWRVLIRRTDRNMEDDWLILEEFTSENYGELTHIRCPNNFAYSFDALTIIPADSSVSGWMTTFSNDLEIGFCSKDAALSFIRQLRKTHE